MRKLCLLPILALFFSAFVVGNLEAATYYIDGLKGKDTNSGSLVLPWKTIGKANSTLKAGDTVRFRAGVYSNEQISPSHCGVNGKPIIYQNYNKEDVVLSGGSRGFSLLHINGKNHIKIIGMKFQHPYCSWGTIEDANHVYVEDCTFDKVNPDVSSMNYRPYFIHNSSHVYHKNCLWTMEDQTSDDDKYMVTIANLNHAMFDKCTFGTVVHCGLSADGKYCTKITNYIVIKNCLFNGEWHAQLSTGCHKLDTDYWLIDGNAFVNAGKSVHLNAYSTRKDVLINPSMYINSKYHIIRNNELYHNEMCMTFRPNGYVDEPMEVWVYNNTMCDTFRNSDLADTQSKAGGVFFHNDSGHRDNPNRQIMRGVHLLNNIFWRSEGDYRGRDFVVHNVYGGMAPYDNVIKNNLFGDPKRTIQGRWAPHGTFAIESLEDNNPQWVDDTNILEQNPLFADEKAHNFALQAGSPAIDRGTWLTTIMSPTADNQTSITVEDATPFYSGSGAPWLIEGQAGDTIKTQNGQTATILSINYDTSTLLVSPAIDIVQGEGLALNYSGKAPDIGAYEYHGISAPKHFRTN